MARQRRGQKQIEWDFFSFPVVFGVALGALIATLFVGLLNDIFLTFTVSLFCVSFGLAHIIGHTWRKRRLDTQLERAEEDERERRIIAARNAAQREQVREVGAPAPARRRRRRRSS
jgi:membrane protein implicated in regulation of membrane protease activity